MNFRTSFQALALAALGALALAAPQRAQAQVDVDVTIELGGIAILYYYSDVDVLVDDTALAGLLGIPAANCAADGSGFACDQGAAAQVTATEAGGNLSADFADVATNNPAIDDLTSVDLTLQDVWAVRAIGGTSANTTVNVSSAGATLANGASEIDVAAFSDDSVVGDSLTTPVFGDVVLPLDLSGATLGGDHSGSAVYQIEITGT